MPQASKDLQILEFKDTIASLNAAMGEKDETIASLRRTVDNLQAQLEYFKQKLFGSASERRKPFEGQLDMFGGESGEPAEIEPEVVTVKEHERKARKPKATYDEMFDKLPVREVVVDELSDEDKICPACGAEMVPVGKECIREELQYTEPKLERVRYVGVTYGCPECRKGENGEKAQFAKNEGEPAVIPGSYASPSLVSHVMYSKYVMGLPLYRLEKDFLRMDAPINRTTMASWIIYCATRYLDPMYGHFHRQLLARSFLMADETPIQVLKEPGRKPQSKSYVWLVRTGEDGGHPIILYNYTPTRAGSNAAEFLDGAPPDFYLMVDGYQGYNKVRDKRRCCCYAHIRREWVRAIPSGHDRDLACPAVQAVMYCDKLFECERKYAEKGYSYEQRHDHRLKDEEPVIDALLAWADKQHGNGSASFDKALTYLNGCRPYMKNYLLDGRCSLSNNASEQNIKTVVMGRKAWLFSDTQDGANASMTVFSMVETAKANGLDPLKYLNYLLETRPDKDMTDDDLARFAPWDDKVISICGK